MNEFTADDGRFPECTCLENGFGSLPPGLRPRPKKNTGLRRVTCPGCGLVYRTNRQTDLCMDCQSKQR